MAGIVDKMIYVPKTWGNELWVVNNDKYCGKVLSLDKGGYCSYHYHLIKDEVLMVTEGRVLFIYSKTPVASEYEVLTSSPEYEQVLLEAGQAWHVTPGIIHQFYGVTPAKITEFSTQHFDEDSYRVARKFIGDLSIIF
jgi:quercetin dioxygenase-like cupin family protein